MSWTGGRCAVTCANLTNHLWPELSARLAGVFATKSVAEWDEIFSGTDACVAPVLSPEASGEDPHIAARGIWFEVPRSSPGAPGPPVFRLEPKACLQLSQSKMETVRAFLSELKIER